MVSTSLQVKTDASTERWRCEWRRCELIAEPAGVEGAVAAAGVAWRERWERRVRSVEGTGAGERESAGRVCGCNRTRAQRCEPLADVAEPIARVAEPIARAAARTDRCLRPIGRESEMGPSLSEMNRL